MAAGNPVRVQVNGLSDLLRAMNQLPKELHKGPLRSAVGAAAKVVQVRAQELAPTGRRAKKVRVRKANTKGQTELIDINPGTLRRAIYRTRDKNNSSAVQEAYIVSVRYGRKYRRRGQDAWYWRFLEFGTSKMAARPFLRPAFTSTADQAVEVLRVKLGASIERIAKNLAKDHKK